MARGTAVSGPRTVVVGDAVTLNCSQTDPGLSSNGCFFLCKLKMTLCLVNYCDKYFTGVVLLKFSYSLIIIF